MTTPGRWRGWAAPASVGEWLDLSHPLRSDLARIPAFPAPRFERIRAMPADPYNLTDLHMVAHFGTHVDAPSHFIPDGPGLHEIPLERLCGPGVVVPVAAEPFGLIEPGALEAARPGDIVLLDTGWARHVGGPRYHEHPSLSVAAAEFLVARGVKLLAVDFPTPDLAVVRRPADFDWPVHHVLLSHGVLIAENVTNLEALSGRRVEAMFLALNVEGADGAPARVVARRCE